MLGWNVEMEQNTKLSNVALKQYLIDIKEHGPNVCVRFRLIGEMWQQHHVRVVAVTENRVLINDEFTNKLISIDMNHVVQFEVDNKYKTLQPNFHYDIVPEYRI